MNNIHIYVINVLVSIALQVVQAQKRSVHPTSNNRMIWCQYGLSTRTLDLDGGLVISQPSKLMCFHLEADRGTLP